MTILRHAAIASLLILFASIAPSQAERPSPSNSSSSDWRPLFDGRTLEGWEHVGPGKFVVEDGVLRTEGGMGLLWYAREKLGQLRHSGRLQDGQCPLQFGRLSSHRRQAQGPRGTRSITVSRFRSWTNRPAVAAPARSTRSPRPPAIRRSPASGTHSKSPSRATASPPRSTEYRRPTSIRPDSNPRRPRFPAKATPRRAPTRVRLHRPSKSRQELHRVLQRRFGWAAARFLEVNRVDARR